MLCPLCSPAHPQCCCIVLLLVFDDANNEDDVLFVFLGFAVYLAEFRLNEHRHL